MMENNIHFSSKNHEWETPLSFFAALNEKFNFTLDVCALPENAKCDKYFTPEEDGLIQRWEGVCWTNPPYGREIKKWMRKAETESRNHGATVVCLVPARTDTAWWHDIALKGDIEFIRGRLKFGNSKNSAPFPSAIVIFGKENLKEPS